MTKCLMSLQEGEMDTCGHCQVRFHVRGRQGIDECTGVIPPRDRQGRSPGDENPRGIFK